MEIPQFNELIRDRLSSLLDIEPNEIQEDVTLDSMGVDSMMRLELIAYVEQLVERELPEKDLLDLVTIRHIVNYVAALQKS